MTNDHSVELLKVMMSTCMCSCSVWSTSWSMATGHVICECLCRLAVDWRLQMCLLFEINNTRKPSHHHVAMTWFVHSGAEISKLGVFHLEKSPKFPLIPQHFLFLLDSPPLLGSKLKTVYFCRPFTVCL